MQTSQNHPPSKAGIYNGESRGFLGGKSDFVTGKPFDKFRERYYTKKGGLRPP